MKEKRSCRRRKGERRLKYREVKKGKKSVSRCRERKTEEEVMIKENLDVKKREIR